RKSCPLHHQSTYMQRLERERAVDGVERSRAILEPGAGIREAEVGGGIGLAGCDDALEGLARRARIASAQGVDACLGVRLTHFSRRTLIKPFRPSIVRL